LIAYDIARQTNGATIPVDALFPHWGGSLARYEMPCSGGIYILANEHLVRLDEKDPNGKTAVHFQPSSGGIRGYQLSSNGDWLYGLSPSGIEIFDARTGESHATLLALASGASVVVTPFGRFDTSKFDEVNGLSWIMPDDPTRPLPLDIFMRDYLEPRLLSKVVNRQEGLLPKLSSVAELNRIQPRVKITHVRPGVSPDQVLVDVEVSGNADPSEPNGKVATEPYDLRLFRNGQLVGEWPEPKEGDVDSTDLATWRLKSHAVPPQGATSIPPFPVRLASQDRGKVVTLTAYAFNEDRIKSNTFTDTTYRVPEQIMSRAKRAYVVTVGVNAYQNSKRNLQYAAADANSLSTSLGRIQGYEVVAVPLISDASADGKTFRIDQATRANIQGVIGLLSGSSQVDRAGLRQRLGKVVERLDTATPDDIVILTFSGHGHSERDGRFYILPSDSGKGDEITGDDLQRLISSEDLTQWLRKVDAGQVVMIIDACYAAEATAEGRQEFKPGPMGDRGLGQLAYDKGMRILAATQAGDVALESTGLRSGLLTYALVVDGLHNGLADLDGDGTITLTEWLHYAAGRVPHLYQEIREGKHVLKSKGQVITAKRLKMTIEEAQTPELFDFQTGSGSVVLPRNADPTAAPLPASSKDIRPVAQIVSRPPN
jgi:hypothetical protein